MIGRIILVTGADHAYAPLLAELMASIRKHGTGRDVAVGVLDCGLDGADVEMCQQAGANIVVPGWDVTFGAGLAVPPSYRAITARPYLRSYFPGFDTYVWIDADTWVQDWSAIELFAAAAQTADIAVVPEVHRSYRNLRDGRDEYETANGEAFAQGFGEAARALIRRPLNNAGVFAMRAGSPAWDTWAGLLADAAQRSTNMIDQIALNVAIHRGLIREARLPAACNWIAHLAVPAWDAARGLYVEPDPPHEPIGILHLTLGTKWAAAIEVPTVGATGSVRRSLRFGG